MNGITERQQEILSFVSAFQREWGAPPTLREIARHFRFSSPTAAAAHLRALRHKGYLEHNPRQARGTRVVRRSGRHGVPPARIPVYSTLPKFSRPGLKQAEGFAGWLPFDSKWGIAHRERVFALTVRGGAWSRWHILDGDLLVMERGRVPVPGEVVAILDDDHPVLTVFTAGRKNGGYYQSNVPPSFSTPDLTTIAVMVALIRMPGQEREFAARASEFSNQ